ncbi:DNA-binding protein [Scytonema hofmannii]|uniref:DNA-binding protein n=1 Tax=Scytonema hofmannii TaxID=34078 RepID=UPI00034706DA|nr:DNA-binding protein [Scytonema hofmannii]
MPQRDRWFKVLLTQQELDKLQAHAELQGWNMSQAFREWIKGLPCYSDTKQN